MEQEFEVDEARAADATDRSMHKALRVTGLDLSVARRRRGLGDHRLEQLLNGLVEFEPEATANHRDCLWEADMAGDRSVAMAFCELLRCVPDPKAEMDVFSKANDVDHASSANRTDVPAGPACRAKEAVEQKPGRNSRSQNADTRCTRRLVDALRERGILSSRIRELLAGRDNTRTRPYACENVLCDVG